MYGKSVDTIRARNLIVKILAFLGNLIARSGDCEMSCLIRESVVGPEVGNNMPLAARVLRRKVDSEMRWLSAPYLGCGA